MIRKQALADLIAKVEAGDATNDGSMFRAFGDKWTLCYDAFHGSLDAALELHEAVLPGAWAHVRVTGKYGHCTVDVDGDEYEADNCASPARAWLLAILKALHAQETEE